MRRFGRMSPWGVALICALFLSPALPVQAAVHHVKSDAAGANDGTSWPDAFSDLQAALAAAGSGDEIWVAAGTYGPAEPGGDRAATFQLKTGVGLYGGFAGTETSREERDWVANETILSGDLNRNDAPFVEPASLRMEPTRSDNSGPIVTAFGDNAVLDGFTVKGGNGHVGGMCLSGTGTVAHCRFVANAGSDGGAVFIDAGNPTLTDCVFDGNAADFGGGAIFIIAFGGSAPSPTLTSCTFTGNTAGATGGALSVSGATPALTDCTFRGNSSSGSGGGMSLVIAGSSGGGGGTRRGGDDGDGRDDPITRSGPMLTGCTFLENSAMFGGGLDWFTATSAQSGTLTDCTFSGNSAESGGGLFFEGGGTLTNCVLAGNSAGRDGGAMYNHGNADLSPAVINCTFVGNVANDLAGGMFVDPVSPRLTNCIFWDNRLRARGGGSRRRGDDAPTEPAAPPDEAAQITGGMPLVTFSCIQGLDVFTGNGNIADDPLFVRAPSDGGDGWGDDPATLDVDEGANDDYGDLRLRPGSPSINAGDPALIAGAGETDLDHRTRVQGGRIDMGPYETPWAQGDSDFDGDVDLANYTSFLACFTAPDVSPEGACASFDFDGDNDVDLADLVAFQAAFTGAE